MNIYFFSTIKGEIIKGHIEKEFEIKGKYYILKIRDISCIIMLLVKKKPGYLG